MMRATNKQRSHHHDISLWNPSEDSSLQDHIIMTQYMCNPSHDSSLFLSRFKYFSHFFFVSSFPATQSKFPADSWNDDRKCISSPTVAPNSKVLASLYCILLLPYRRIHLQKYKTHDASYFGLVVDQVFVQGNCKRMMMMMGCIGITVKIAITCLLVVPCWCQAKWV